MQSHETNKQPTKTESNTSSLPKTEPNDFSQHSLINIGESSVKKSSEAFVDSGKRNTQLKQIRDIANDNPQINQLRAYQQMADTSKIKPAGDHQNTNGLPAQLKSGAEKLSGESLDDVNVHYNSDKPAQFQALAYAQGNNIHIAPGQEKHLPHETWHVVQQKQGRVNPTTQLQTIDQSEISAVGNQVLPIQRLTEGSNSIANSPADITQFATDPNISTGVSLDLLGNPKSLSDSFRESILEKELGPWPKAKALCLVALAFAFNGLVSLSNWLKLVVDAYGALKTIAAIPRGVVAVFLWGLGKSFLWFADRYYNKRWVAKIGGDIEEEHVYSYMHGADVSHSKIQDFVNYVKSIVDSITKVTSSYIGSFFGGSGEQEKEEPPKESEEASTKEGNKKISTPSFISLNVDTPKLTQWKNEETIRDGAGLEAKASAHLSLLGQKMGGDLNIKLPFGSGWQIAVQNFFQSSGITLSGFHIDYISGDNLTFTDKGLVEAGMSVHGFKIQNVLEAKSISVIYKQGKIEFEGKDGTFNLLSENTKIKRVFLTINTDGSFDNAGIEIDNTSSTEIIPGYLEVQNPNGKIAIYNGKSPDVSVNATIIAKGLPGVKDARARGGVSFKDQKLSGHIKNLTLVIPLGKKATLKVNIVEAVFNSEEVTAEKASIDFDYDKNIHDEENTDPGKAAKDIITGDLAWLDVSQFVDLEKLSVSQGLTNLNLKAGKFGYTKDDNNGLRALKAKVLGISGEYDGEKNEGSLSGTVEKDIEANLIKLDFPLGGVGGAYLEMKGTMGFGASLTGTMKKDPEKSTKQVTAMLLSGEVDANARAGISLHAGAFIGVPYLANLKGGLFGEIKGNIGGKVKMDGGLLYDKDKSKISKDPAALPKGDFVLKGILTAKVGGEIKAQILVFEKDIVKIVLGDWEIGHYQLVGNISSDEAGMPVFNITKQGFDGEPKPPSALIKPIPLKEWLDKIAEDKGTITYDTEPEKKVGKVARDIVYGRFTEDERTEIKVQYITLLNPSYQSIFILEYNRLQELRAANFADSFIWSAVEWDKAVNRRKILGIFEQSESKQKISELIEGYHKLQKADFEAKLKKLTDIQAVITNYVTNRSKVPENKLEASQLMQQITMEKEKISAAKLVK